MHGGLRAKAFGSLHAGYLRPTPETVPRSVAPRSPKRIRAVFLGPLESPGSSWIAAALLLGSACGAREDAAPRWTDLATGFRPRPLLEIARGWGAALPLPERPAVELHDDATTVWLETAIPRDRWHSKETPGHWWTPRPHAGGFEQFPEGPTRLAAGEHEFKRFTGKGTIEPGCFFTSSDRIFLSLSEGEEPPEKVIFGVRAGSGLSFDGVWHVRWQNGSGTGIPVWGGEREEVLADVPPRSALRVSLAFSPPAVPPSAPEKPRFRILLDGDPLLEHELTEGSSHHRVLLPSEGSPRARFAFEVAGAHGLGLFVDPTIGPAEFDPPASPDVVLVLADTFRADNLKAWGGTEDLAPNLDRLAERSVRFLSARAAASWTLPSISSLLTGTYPPQHGATDDDLSLSRELSTMAEVFRRQGYRTGAVTDSGFFSPGFGLEQGFDWFVEFRLEEWSLDRTLDEALAFLERDDGRPVFLVAHTYRVHSPYRQGPTEDTSAWDALYAEGLQRFSDQERTEPGIPTKIYLSMVDSFQALYRDAVRDLDAKFPRFLSGLEARGLFANGYLVFTSDHGEAFGENGDVCHGRDLWDVKLRVPLFIHGSGLAPRAVESPASLVDLPPTLAELAHLPPDPTWEGVPLLHAPAERAIYAFELVKDLKQLAILDRDRKVFADPDPDLLARGQFRKAFDLVDDPEEHRELGETEPWPTELCRTKAEDVRRLLVPQAAPAPSSGGAELDEQLRALGYGGR